jgi:hypothetical protein
MALLLMPLHKFQQCFICAVFQISSEILMVKGLQNSMMLMLNFIQIKQLQTLCGQIQLTDSVLKMCCVPLLAEQKKLKMSQQIPCKLTSWF